MNGLGMNQKCCSKFLTRINPVQRRFRPQNPRRQTQLNFRETNKIAKFNTSVWLASSLVSQQGIGRLILM